MWAMQPSSRNERLDIRITPHAKQTLSTAAQTLHKSLSEFVLDAVMTEAENVLAEKRLFLLSPEAWKNFKWL